MNKQQQLSDELHEARLSAHSATRQADEVSRREKSDHECEVIALKKCLLERDGVMKQKERQHNEEAAAISQADADELTKVNTRVRQAIEKEDATIGRLREQL